MDSETLSTRRQQISNATLRRMSGTPERRNGWSLGGCIAVVLIVVFACVAVVLAL